jgi:hypothetical protein
LISDLLPYAERRELVFSSETNSIEKFKWKLGQKNKEIPCKVTHPEVQVTLRRTKLFTVESLTQVRYFFICPIAHGS